MAFVQQWTPPPPHFFSKNSKRRTAAEARERKESVYRAESDDAAYSLEQRPATTGAEGDGLTPLEPSKEESAYELASESYTYAAPTHVHSNPAKSIKPKITLPKPGKPAKKREEDEGASYYNSATVDDDETMFTRNSIYESGN